jgi:RecB family exonuclease
MEILGIELPLSTMISDDINLIGGIDLLLRDEKQNLIVVDTKTAAKAKTQTDVDNDLQLSGYSYLLVENGYASKSDFILCRLDVLRKLKTPRLEQYFTTRNVWHRKRFVIIAKSVLSGIENSVFIPTRSWLCSDCQFSNACAGWR